MRIAPSVAGIVVLVAFGLSPMALAQKNAETAAQDTKQRPTQTEDTARARAKQWDLSVDEWDRYQTLLKGIDGYRSDKLDPITELGIRARSPAERQRYARKLARLEHARVQRVLAFQHAYDSAWKDLYPQEKPVRTDRLAHALAAGRQNAQKLGLSGDRRKAVFVRAHDCAACRATVKRLAASHTPMDIYVVDAAGDDDAIRTWATQLGLDPKRVRSGDITLNHAPAAAAQQLDAASLPRVVDR